jgi:hypothetical protein
MESRTFFTKKLCGPRNKDGQVLRPNHLQLPYFYALPKVHNKTPWKTRPVVSGVFTVVEPLSQWIDTQLKRVIHRCPSHLKDGWQLVSALRDILTLPPDAVCYIADAISLYSNINTDTPRHCYCCSMAGVPPCITPSGLPHRARPRRT